MEKKMALHLKSTGIDFSALSDDGPSVDSEILDDYEEGTWTPSNTFQNATSENSKTHNVQAGNYIKIGQFLYGSFSIQGNWSGGNQDNVNTNVPMARGNNGGYLIVGYGYTSGTSDSSIWHMGAGANSMQVTQGDGAGNFTQFLTQGNNSPYNYVGTFSWRTA